jgi:hypothetical protein
MGPPCRWLLALLGLSDPVAGRLALRCCFAEATARSAGSWRPSLVSAWALAVLVLKGLCLLLEA